MFRTLELLQHFYLSSKLKVQIIFYFIPPFQSLPIPLKISRE